MIRFIKILVLVGVLSSATYLMAQEKRDSLNHSIIRSFSLDASNVATTVDTGAVKIVSVSRSAQYITDLPFQIYVITHEEIVKNGYTTLTDALKSLPGMRVSQPGTGEYGESFQIRGLPGNQYAKILINNIPIKPSVVAGMPIAHQLPIRQAERIEVIYGPAAAVYGADAVTGVINIILKEATKGTFVRADIFVGEGNYNYANFTVGGKAGKNRNILEYTVYANKMEHPNIDIFRGYSQTYNPLVLMQQQGIKVDLNGTLYNPIDITPEILNNNGISEQEFIEQHYGLSYQGSLSKPLYEVTASSGHLIGANLKFRGVGFTYNTMYRKTHSSFGLSPLYCRFDNPQNYWADKIQQFSLSYSYDIRGFSTSTNISALSYSMDNTSSMGLTHFKTDRAYLYSQSLDILAEHFFSINPTRNSEIVVGGSYQISDNLPLTNYLETPFSSKWYKPFNDSQFPSQGIMGQFGYNPVSQHNISAFAQGFATYRKFNFIVGTRYDVNSLYGSSFNPRVALQYKLNKRLSGLTSFGLAYKVPPTSMTYRSFAYVPVSEPSRIKYVTLPNSSLKPEGYKSLELGLILKVGKNFTANLSGFFNEITNPIVNTRVPIDLAKYPLATAANDSLWASKFINSSKAVSRLYGFQASMRLNNIVEKYQMHGELNLSLSRQSEEAPELVEFIVSNIQLMPRHMGQLSLWAQPHKNFSIRTDMVWMTKWLRVLIPFESLYSKLFSDVDGFFTLDISSNITLDDNLMITIKGKNILNEKYSGFVYPNLDYSMPYSPQMGRNFTIGLSYMFN